MPPTTLLLATCASLALVQAASTNWSRVQRDLCQGIMQDTELHAFTIQEDDHCQAEDLSEAWEREIGRAYCQVRPVLVRLNPEENHEYHPSMILVNRCVGDCGRLPCIATKRSAPRFYQVTRTNLLGETKCGQVAVHEHEACDCAES